MRWSAPWRPRSPPDGVGHRGRAAGGREMCSGPRGSGRTPIRERPAPQPGGYTPGRATTDARAGPRHAPEDATARSRARRATTLPKSYDCWPPRTPTGALLLSTATAQESHIADSRATGAPERGDGP